MILTFNQIQVTQQHIRIKQNLRLLLFHEIHSHNPHNFKIQFSYNSHSWTTYYHTTPN